MPAHDRSGMRVDAYVCRILAAIIRKSKTGEIRISGADVDAIDEKVLILKDWSTETQEVVLRLGSPFHEIYQVLPEAPKQWTQPTTSQTRHSSVADANPEGQPSTNGAAKEAEQKLASTIKTNQELAQIEADFRRRQILRMMRQEKEQRQTEFPFPTKP
jgi:hypothetical protein